MRRRALLCFAPAATALAATALAARPARAFREAVASPDVAQDYADRCKAYPVPAGAGPVNICPFCGCPVVGARDHGEAGPLPPN